MSPLLYIQYVGYSVCIIEIFCTSEFHTLGSLSLRMVCAYFCRAWCLTFFMNNKKIITKANAENSWTKVHLYGAYFTLQRQIWYETNRGNVICQLRIIYSLLRLWSFRFKYSPFMINSIKWYFVVKL